jgi:hypothetical protein
MDLSINKSGINLEEFVKGLQEDDPLAEKHDSKAAKQREREEKKRERESTKAMKEMQDVIVEKAVKIKRNQIKKIQEVDENNIDVFSIIFPYPKNIKVYNSS